MLKQWYDLSQAYREGMPEAAGHEKLALQEHVSELTGSHITNIRLNSHTGTHIDAPFHFLRDKPTIDEIPLERFTGRAAVINIEKKELEQITPNDLVPYKNVIEETEILFIRTGWEEKWSQEDYTWKYPYVSKEAAEYLASTKIKIFGTDTISPDPSVKSGLRKKTGSPAHVTLLSHDILVIENLTNLKSVLGKKLLVFAFPLKIIGSDGSPIRVVACDL